jgi:hypothetical protein
MESVSRLSEDIQAARRIAFMFALVASSLGIPLNKEIGFDTISATLLQCAMEQPELVTPDEFKLIYTIMMRPREVL